MTNGREENRELLEDNQSNISEEVTHHQEGNESSHKDKDDDSQSLTSEEQPSKVSESNTINNRSVARLLLLVCIFTRGSSHPFLRCTIFNEYAEKDQGRGFSGGQ